MSDEDVPESEQCGNTIHMDGFTRRCCKRKGHTGKHSDYPWAEGLDSVVYE